MPSHFIDYRLFGDLFSTPEIRDVFDERTMLQRWLDVEVALAHAQADLHLVPREAAAAIARAARVENLDRRRRVWRPALSTGRSWWRAAVA